MIEHSTSRSRYRARNLTSFLVVLVCSFAVLKAVPIQPDSHWDLRKDINSILEVDSPDFDDTGLYEKYLAHRGMSTARYITMPQIKQFFSHVIQDYPEIARMVEVENEPGDICLITKEYQQVLKLGKGKPASSSILLTGAHHSRELTSVQMVCYALLRIIYEYEQESYLDSLPEPSFHDLLEMHSFLIIPVVNLDGLHEIEQEYNQTKKLTYIRKNMHPFKKMKCKHESAENYGVDLNRNYDFAFAFDDIGSNPNPCEEDYRGPYAFSEPGTRQIKNLIEETPEGRGIKIALNFHAWGNLLVHPWSYLKKDFTAGIAREYTDAKFHDYLKDTMCMTTIKGATRFYFRKTVTHCGILSEQELIDKDEAGQLKLIDMNHAFSFYSNLVESKLLPNGFKDGNGFAMVDYPANGEASDWMLGRHGILAMSPELGTQDKRSESFFFYSKSLLKRTISQNYPWIKYTAMQLLPRFEVKVQNIYEPRRHAFNSTSVILTMELLLQGFGVPQDQICHDVLLRAAYPDLILKKMQLYKGRSFDSTTSSYSESDEADSHFLQWYQQLSIIDPDQSHHDQPTDLSIYLKQLGKTVVQMNSLKAKISPKERGLTVCFLNQTSIDAYSKLQATIALKIDLTRKDDVKKKDFLPNINAYDDYLQIVHAPSKGFELSSLFDKEDLTQKEVFESLKEDHHSSEKKNDLPRFRQEGSVTSIAYGDIQVLTNVQEPTPNKIDYSSQKKMRASYDMEADLSTRVGMSRVSPMETTSILIPFVIILAVIFSYAIMFIFDLNLTEDILKFGLLRRLVRRACNRDDCYLRYNYIQKQRQQKEMALELAREHAEEQLEQEQFEREQELLARSRAMNYKIEEDEPEEEEEEGEEGYYDEEDESAAVNN